MTPHEARQEKKMRDLSLEIRRLKEQLNGLTMFSHTYKNTDFSSVGVLNIVHKIGSSVIVAFGFMDPENAFIAITPTVIDSNTVRISLGEQPMVGNYNVCITFKK